LRYTKAKFNGENRHKYVHRVIANKLCNETPWVMQLHTEGAWEEGSLPPYFVVHHVDFCKTHNCPENFIIMDEALHNGTIHEGQARQKDGRWDSMRAVARVRNDEDMPDWVTEDWGDGQEYQEVHASGD
jgi:hypothetical protein